MTPTGIALSVIDQCPMRRGGTAADALREALELARAAEGLGYSRYWVAEHHNANSYACTSPELLIPLAAANTSTIRVGSGGVMLLNYSALKVAEQFRMLHALYPGRIDLGIGRAPGGDPLAAEALAYPRPRTDPREFPRQLTDLLAYLEGVAEEGHPFAEVRAQPGPPPASGPEVWLLGSSTSSATFAARLGLPFAFADFLNSSREEGYEAAESYRQNFRPSRWLDAPRLSVAVEVLCAPTQEEASFLARSRDFDTVAELYRIQGLLPPHEAVAYQVPEEVKRYMEDRAKRCIDGDPARVRETILEMSRLYGTGDIGVVTNCYDFGHRVRSYELLAEAVGLTSGGSRGD
jgi:luciferase family oxidoreductase group 1